MEKLISWLEKKKESYKGKWWMILPIGILALLIALASLFRFVWSPSKSNEELIAKKEGEAEEAIRFNKEREERADKILTEALKEKEQVREQYIIIKTEETKQLKEIDDAEDWDDIDKLAGVSDDITISVTSKKDPS